MLAQTIRASRSSIARLARPSLVSRRTLITPTAVRQVDLVQDMYLKELKAYKPVPTKASDSVGNVQIFSAPKPPKSPEEADIASELKAYEASTVELEGQAIEGEAPVKEESWFEEEEDDAPAAH